MAGSSGDCYITGIRGGNALTGMTSSMDWSATANGGVSGCCDMMRKRVHNGVTGNHPIDPTACSANTLMCDHWNGADRKGTSCDARLDGLVVQYFGISHQCCTYLKKFGPAF